MAGLLTPLPLQFIRQYAGAVDQDQVFINTSDRIAYLTNPRRHAGMIVTDIQEGKVYYLNNTEDQWIEVGNSDIVVDITKSDIDTLITNNSLAQGKFYKIKGVHPALYNDGTTGSNTTIIVQALDTNVLSTKAVGIFYTPKYNQGVADYGIWSNRSTYVASSIVGTFNANELITANNGATGQIFSTIYSNKFIALTGDWSTATSITGNVTSATANITSVVVKSYTSDDTVIWGGYVWKNLNGNLGSATDILTLDSEWEKLPFDTDNYNISYDNIEYDYDNDIITKRSDKFGNIVISNKDDNALWVSKNGAGNYYGHPIAVFQWGNPYVTSTTKGVGNNSVLHAYLECINISGNVYANEFYPGTAFQRNVLVQSQLRNNIVNIGEIRANVLNNGVLSDNHLYAVGYSSTTNTINSNTLDSSQIIKNHLLNGGSISSNTMYNSYIFMNRLGGGYSSSSACRINSNILINSNGIYSNFLETGSQISSNSLLAVGSYITDNKLQKQVSINSNTLNTYGIIAMNTLEGFSQMNSNTLTGINSGNTATISYNKLYGAQMNSNTISGGKCDITYCYLGDSYAYTDAAGQCKINSNTVNNGGNIEDCYLRSGAELTHINTAYHIAKLNIDNCKLDFGSTAFISGLSLIDYTNREIKLRLTKTFNGASGSGAIGSVTFQPFPILSGYFIEELIVDVGSGLTGSGAVINLGFDIDAPSVALNDTTGNVATLNTAKVTKIALSTFTKNTASRNIIMAIKNAAITAGTININLKLSKLT